MPASGWLLGPLVFRGSGPALGQSAPADSDDPPFGHISSIITSVSRMWLSVDVLYALSSTGPRHISCQPWCMNEQLAVLQLVVSRLEALNITYMITGSVALAAYATPRMTRDIDVVIDCNVDQAVALARAFQADSYASVDAAREAAVARGMFSVIHDESLLKIDFIVRPSDEFNEGRFARRLRIDLGEFAAFFSSPEDLILAKLRWRRDTGSLQQARDVQSPLASGLALDWDYLRTWSARLGVVDDLEQARQA